MSKLLDLTGQRFGRLTVIKRAEDRIRKSGKHEICWLCKCDCGNEKVVSRDNLKSGKTLSCGCLNKEIIGSLNFTDLTSKQFGYLTVICQDGYYIDPKGNRRSKWLCQCECGNITSVICSNLIRGTTVSCGCYGKRKLAESNRKYNTYDLSGEYGIGYTSKGEEFFFDLEDYDKIKDYYWRTDENNYFISTTGNKNKPQNFHLHRIIMLDEENMKNLSIDIDYINGINSRNDNRKVNLRITTRSQNNQNRTLRSDTKSGFMGVSYNKQILKWESYLSINYKKYNLGYFSDFTEAVKARIEGEQKYFGEYAYKSHQKVLDYINNGGKLEPYNRQIIEDIMN